MNSKFGIQTQHLNLYYNAWNFPGVTSTYAGGIGQIQIKTFLYMTSLGAME